MKYYAICFSLCVMVLMTSCGDSSTDVNGSNEVKDYLWSGNVGSQLVYLETNTYFDQNGSILKSHVDTNIYTILETNAVHPKGGNAVRYRLYSTLAPTNKSDSNYFSVYNGGIAFYNTGQNAPFNIILKGPLTVGNSWSSEASPSSYKIESVGENISTPYKSFQVIRVLGTDNLHFGAPGTIDFKYYFAPDVLYARAEVVQHYTPPALQIATIQTTIELINIIKK